VVFYSSLPVLIDRVKNGKDCIIDEVRFSLPAIGMRLCSDFQKLPASRTIGYLRE
jgi:hypothetical protein